TYSASASEILAGAISDNDRGVIVGSRTFGKGLVQRPLHFPDGSMIRLTVARYYTPSGRCIQKPYTAGDTDAYADDLRHRFTSGELTSADSIHLADSTVYRTLRLGRPVYGGGGIIPDAFVPIDTTLITPLYRSLMAKGVISNFATGYIDRHRGKLRSLYPSEEEYVATADPASDPAMMDAFKAAAADEQIVIDEEEFAISEPLIKTILKALIGREIFGTETYYKIVNPLTPAFLKAVEIINSPQTYNSYLSRPTNPE
ncbi:MAG: peptidase S41, partial [Duncaniella sp.]|nr:peptidase S41 [Duncaniella sp.]